MFDKIKFKYLEKKYQKAKKVYIVCLWARYGVLEARFSGKFDKDNNLLTIQYSDHNGEYESYFIAPWYYETTGATIAYSFNEQDAQILANKLNQLYGYNYIGIKNE